MSACMEAGFEMDAYVWLYFAETPPAAQMTKAIATCHGYPIRRLWIDCEDTSIHGIEQMVTLIGEALDACWEAEISAGIYTRRAWWRRWTGDTMAYRSVPLWDCQPDRIADLGQFEPYGGWQRREMKQYEFDLVLGSGSVDLNVYWGLRSE